MSDLSDIEELIDLYRVRKRYEQQLGQEYKACEARERTLYEEHYKAIWDCREVWRKIEALIKGDIEEE